jgi:transcriptional regulator with XRE-family HTH domain
MEFKRPFDPPQRTLAARLYKSYRNDLKGIRAKYPPGTAEERQLLKEFQQAARAKTFSLATFTASRPKSWETRTRGWTLSRIAHAVEASRTLLTRIEAGTDRFSPGQVRRLAKAARTTTSRLFFDAMEPAALKSSERDAWIATCRTLELSEEFRRSIATKPVRKRRARTKAA